MTQFKNVFFRPWEGTHYGKRPFGRLLVLGESHHGSKPRPNWTIAVVEQYIANEDSAPWFSRFTKIGRCSRRWRLLETQPV